MSLSDRQAVNLSDEQILRIQECLNLRVGMLDRKQAEIDAEIREEVHELRSLLNYLGLELTKRRLKK